MNNKDKILLETSKSLKTLLEDFKLFMSQYEIDEELPLFNEHGKDSLDYVISEFSDIIENLE